MTADNLDLDQYPARIGPFELKGVRDMLGVVAVLAPASGLSGRQLCAVGDRRSVGERVFGTTEIGMPRCP